ncbi:hypothetical protein MF672_028855 [Actinomadura sp. ATCC 31491]|uniref:Uncharacterized protein n=1 Tax=Actinomadura luzonensis TaxID=2805427 RepID=A0ABT0FZK9_9ACTN|nr:hypothetical protein [Actinomadura luzonensis]MCK2217774.1 hypothetical protein [Actinomadura luzonensis]
MRGRIAVCAMIVAALGYLWHRIGMVLVAWLLGNTDMIVGLDCCVDYHRNAPDPWANVLIALSGVICTQVVAWTAIALLAARRGPTWGLTTVAVTLFAVSPVLQLVVYLVWHYAERDYVAVIDYTYLATGLPLEALIAVYVVLFVGYGVVFGLALRAARERAGAGAVRRPAAG